MQQADKIVVKGIGLYSQPITLIRKNNFWRVLVNQTEYPAKQESVDYLFRLLSTKALYPIRSTSFSSHEKLGVSENLASRIIVYGGASQIPLLDLLIGSGNLTGIEIYLRKNGTNEVRSGADEFTHYADAAQKFWFNLKLFSKDKTLTSNMIQQVSIYKNDFSKNITYTLSRQANEQGTFWKIDSSPEMIVDNNKAESYLRSLLATEAADFALNTNQSTYDFNFGNIELLFDDLSVTKIMFASKTENDQYPVMMSGNPFIYLIPEWTVERIFRDVEYFASEE
jgi:hypothetical protein